MTSIEATKPTSVEILGKIYTIKYNTDVDSGGNLGSSNRPRQVISLNYEANGPDQLEETLLHEIIHIVDGELRIELTEEDVSRLAVGLYSAGYRISK